MRTMNRTRRSRGRWYGNEAQMKAKRWRQNKAVIYPRIGAHARVAEFPGQTLIVEHGKLMCQTCRKHLT